MRTPRRIFLPPATTTSVVLQIRPPRRSPFIAETGSSKHEARNNIKCSRRKLETASRLDHSSLSVIRTCFGFSSFGFCSPSFRIFLSLLLILSWQLSAYSVPAGNRGGRPANKKKCRTSPWGRYKKLARVRSIDGIDYVEFESTAPKDQRKQPSPEGDNSPDAATDLDESDNALDDLSVGTPRRNDQNVAHFSVRDFDAVNIRASGTTQFLLSPDHSFYCLHQHIRERAPPCLASHL